MIAKIRPMTQDDIDSVYAIEAASHLAPWSRDILSDCVLVGYDCRVIELEEESVKQIIGYIICRYSFDVYHILNLCVKKDKQGQGYGKFLLRAVLNSLKKPKVNAVILEVRPSNLAAMALYKSFEFKEELIKKGYYKDQHGEEDAILLKKLIQGL